MIADNGSIVTAVVTSAHSSLCTPDQGLAGTSLIANTRLTRRADVMASVCWLLPNTPSYILLVDEDTQFSVLNCVEHSSVFGGSTPLFALCLGAQLGL